MRKKKLALHRETLRHLSTPDSKLVVGGLQGLFAAQT